MSNNRLRFDGLDELKASLRRLPKDLRDDAEAIVLDNAQKAVNEIVTGYGQHRVSGELINGLELVQEQGGRLFAGAVVQNKSKLAFIFENGTQVRHNALGANRGRMPPGHVFVPAMIKWRRTMYDELRQMMTGHGLVISG